MLGLVAVHSLIHRLLHGDHGHGHGHSGGHGDVSFVFVLCDPCVNVGQIFEWCMNENVSFSLSYVHGCDSDPYASSMYVNASFSVSMCMYVSMSVCMQSDE
jgi:hypothetical protein